ncbi:MAG: hypothetical protein ACFCGT_19625 [Sandaracinaceae bacterium]
MIEPRRTGPLAPPADPRAPLRVVLSATLALYGLAGCEDDEPPPPLETPKPAEDRPGGPSEARDPVVDGQEGRSGPPVTLGPGFVPDPQRAQGRTAGGPIAASLLDERCQGFIDPMPDHVIEATGTFAELLLMVGSETDTTLSVLDPSGRVHCGDDEDGVHPLVRFRAVVGTYRVWVGTREPGQSVPYVLGLSELEDTRPSGLLH